MRPGTGSNFASAAYVNELFVDVGDSLILDCVPLSMCIVKDAPLLGRKPNGVREGLENQVSILRTVSAKPKGRQGDGIDPA